THWRSQRLHRPRYSRAPASHREPAPEREGQRSIFAEPSRGADTSRSYAPSLLVSDALGLQSHSPGVVHSSGLERCAPAWKTGYDGTWGLGTPRSALRGSSRRRHGDNLTFAAVEQRFQVVVPAQIGILNLFGIRRAVVGRLHGRAKLVPEHQLHDVRLDSKRLGRWR